MSIRRCPNGHALTDGAPPSELPTRCPECGVPLAVAPEIPVPFDPAGADPAAIDPDAVEWRLVMPGGDQHGPTVTTIFAQWIVAGRVPPDALVWRTGWAQWRPADEAAAELPAPLPVGFSAGDPTPPSTEPDRTVAEAAPRTPKQTPTASLRTDRYAERRRRQTQRRRLFTVGLAVVCLLLAAMLGWFAMSGPPDGAPVVGP